jgi:hypothetical protein
LPANYANRREMEEMKPQINTDRHRKKLAHEIREKYENEAGLKFQSSNFRFQNNKFYAGSQRRKEKDTKEIGRKYNAEFGRK